MARISIDIPETLPFSTSIDIRISDINYGGHVGNDTVLALLHEARMRWLHQSGHTELDFFGAGLIMSDAAIIFKAELFYGDQLTVAMGVSDITRVGFTLLYRVTRTTDLAVAVLAKTGMVCYAYSRKKVSPLPAAFREKWGEVSNGK